MAHCISLNKSPGVYSLTRVLNPAYKQVRLLIKTSYLFQLKVLVALVFKCTGRGTA